MVNKQRGNSFAHGPARPKWAEQWELKTLLESQASWEKMP